jgi:O-antigen/teichoic acid export membrane protein
LSRADYIEMTDTTMSIETTQDTAGHQLARNAFFLLTGQIVSSALAIVLTAFLGRWLGVAEFGNYYLLVAVSTFAYMANFLAVRWPSA